MLAGARDGRRRPLMVVGLLVALLACSSPAAPATSKPKSGITIDTLAAASGTACPVPLEVSADNSGVDTPAPATGSVVVGHPIDATRPSTPRRIRRSTRPTASRCSARLQLADGRTLDARARRGAHRRGAGTARPRRGRRRAASTRTRAPSWPTTRRGPRRASWSPCPAPKAMAMMRTKVNGATSAAFLVSSTDTQAGPGRADRPPARRAAPLSDRADAALVVRSNRPAGMPGATRGVDRWRRCARAGCASSPEPAAASAASTPGCWPSRAPGWCSTTPADTPTAPAPTSRWSRPWPTRSSPAGGEAVVNTDSASSWEGAQRLVNQAVETYGDLHVVINNAGILRDRVLVNMTEDEWDGVIDVHLKGTFAPAAVGRGVLARAGQGRGDAGQPDHQHLLGVRPVRQPRPDELRRGQGRASPRSPRSPHVSLDDTA